MSHTLVLAKPSDDWAQAYRCINALLREGACVMWASEPFTVVTRSADTLPYERGGFLVTEVPEHVAGDRRGALEAQFAVTLHQADRVDGFVGRTLRPLRIAMYGGGGAPYNHARIFAELGFTVDFISPQEVRAGGLAEFDMFGMPGGGGIAMKGQLDPLGENGCRRIAEFVRGGGMYLGSCAGSFDAALVSESFLAVCPQQRCLQLINAAVWNSSDTEWVGLKSPGVGVLKSRNAQPDHPVMWGIPEIFDITHYNGPLFSLQPGTLPDASDAEGLSAVAGTTEDFTPSEAFLRFEAYSPEEAGDTLIGRAAGEGRFNVVCGHNGLGRVVLFGSHPEFGYNLAMDQWGEPARMLANAAFWQGSFVTREAPPARGPAPWAPQPRSHPLGAGLSRVADRLPAISSAVGSLRERDVHDADWLSDALAMSTFGLSGRQIWERNLAEFDAVAEAITQTIARLGVLSEEVASTAGALRAVDAEAGRALSDALEDALGALEEALHHHTPEAWQQDFGYEGVLQMIARAERMLRLAGENFETEFAPSDNPYEHFYGSPFQLVVGSYLAAIGVFGNCWQLLEVHRCRLEALALGGRLRLN